MSSLSPVFEFPNDTKTFKATINSCTRECIAKDAIEFGDKYYYMEPFGRTRGSSHMFIPYIECNKPGHMTDFVALGLTESMAKRTIYEYGRFMQRTLDEHRPKTLTEEDYAAQLEFHTVYFFQILVLDCVTTSFLLSHADNDIGILGCLPKRIDGALLTSWKEKIGEPQTILLDSLIECLPNKGEGVSEITYETRADLAKAVRAYYREDLERLKGQAWMDMDWWHERSEHWTEPGGPMYKNMEDTRPEGWQSEAEKKEAESGLPDGWQSAEDPASGNTYYYNADGTTQWEKPS